MEFPTEEEEEKFCLARRTVAYLSCTFPQFCVLRKKVAWFLPWRACVFLYRIPIVKTGKCKKPYICVEHGENEIFCLFSTFLSHFMERLVRGGEGGYNCPLRKPYALSYNI